MYNISDKQEKTIKIYKNLMNFIKKTELLGPEFTKEKETIKRIVDKMAQYIAE